MDPTAIKEQVDRILSSQNFESKRQLRKLLEVLCQHLDSQSALKPDLIIKELWPEEIRTKRSADVATEMNRLRRALEDYYKGEGKADPVLIVLPNRSAPAANGTPEKRWIAAISREEAEDIFPIGRSGPEPSVLPISTTDPPVNSAKGLKIIASIAAIVVLGLVVYLANRGRTADRRPQYGRLKGSTLTILNAEGQELWKKTFRGKFDPDSYYESDPMRAGRTHLWFGDLEGQGRTSVLFAYAPVGEPPQSSILICYSDRGKEKWRWTPDKVPPERKKTGATLKITALAVLKAADKRTPQLVVASVRNPWWSWPSQIALLDANGKTISEYWHSGSLAYLTVADLDGDGKEEIIATGNSIGYDRGGALVVLNPSRVFGASTEVRPEYQIHGMGTAQERLRLLFPRSDLNRASFQSDYAIEPSIENGTLRVEVLECMTAQGCPVWYEFDRNFHLISVDAARDFRNAYDRFYRTGNDAHTLSAAEQASFQNVRCLVGCKEEFVPVVESSDPAKSFEKGWTAHSNPNGVWSYGFSSGFTNPITLYDKTVQIGVNGPNAQYWLSSSADVGTSPAAEYNNGPAYDDENIDFLANEFVLVAGIGGQYSDLRFTAPANGEYSVDGNFRGAQHGIGTVVGIVANEKVLFSARVTSDSQLLPFHIALSLKAGSTVVFSVGPGGGRQNTGLSATITRPRAPKVLPAFTVGPHATGSRPAA